MEEDKRLYLIRLLYGEVLPDGMAPEADSELAAEWQAMQEVKRWLDAQPRRRPDPTVIDRIVAAAARPLPADRPAQRPLRRRRWRVLVGILMLLTFAGSLWYWLKTLNMLEQPAMVVAEQVSTAPEPVDESFWLHLVAQPSASLTTAPVPSHALVLRWDDRAAVQQVYRQLQLLEARSTSDTWEPALPLEAWPTGNGRRGFVPASRRDY